MNRRLIGSRTFRAMEFPIFLLMQAPRQVPKAAVPVLIIAEPSREPGMLFYTKEANRSKVEMGAQLQEVFKTLRRFPQIVLVDAMATLAQQPPALPRGVIFFDIGEPYPLEGICPVMDMADLRQLRQAMALAGVVTQGLYHDLVASGDGLEVQFARWKFMRDAGINAN